ASELSGGDGIYAFDLSNPEWQNNFKNLQPAGQMSQLEANLSMLSQQVEEFEFLPYQDPITEIPVSVGETASDIRSRYESTGKFEMVKFAQYLTLSEDYDRSSLLYGWDSKLDTRQKYDLTSSQIIAKAKEFEGNGENFFLWAGHGSDPFYMQMATMEGILKVAPNTFKAFVFAELEDHNAAMEYVIQKQLIPLAELCLKYGNRKILLRTKNIFWTGTAYLDLWQDLFTQERYKDIFVPTMEETNSRCQALSLSGRTGLWMTGAFSSVSGRPVTDNANYNRSWEWGQTQHLSNMIRAMSQRRIQGADLFHVNIYTMNEEKMIPFYLMLEKGILPKVNAEDIVSVNDVAIGIKAPPHAEYISHGTNGHGINTYEPSTEKYVFDKLDCYWGGTPIPEWDFTRYAMNSKRRMTNFIAQSPYGNIATIPAATDIEKHKQFSKMLVTDGKYWYDEADAQQSPDTYKSHVLDELEQAAERLPIRVTGDVAWSAVMLDSNAYRIVLIDPGYLDPAEQEAIIHLQNLEGFDAMDILTNEALPISNDEISITVPMGILRVVDLVKYPIAKAGNDLYISELPLDSVVFTGIGVDDVEIITYKWTQVTGPECTLINTDSSTLTIKDIQEGDYTFKLTVIDDLGNNDADDVDLIVFCESCHIPKVNAGSDRIVKLPKDTVLFHGTASVSLGEIVSTEWKIETGPVATLSGADTPDLEISDLIVGSYKLKFTAISDSNYSSSDIVNLEVYAATDSIRMNTNIIEIDGVLEEDWCGELQPIDEMLEGWLNEPTNATFLWDDSCLYIFVQIEDDYRISDSGSEWWEDDAVEVFIDADNSRNSYYDENDFHFGFRWDDETVYEQEHSATDGVEWMITKSNKGYNLEVKIPWLTLNHLPVS
ncbi:MAG: hypothetical protein PF450_13945, partial [Bacteroidales bacterium]|nr:hypothetical protein [Bacteroidales bacterium]